ncbi:cytochrome P450 [Nocardia jiangxiensis]|uniref:Cytochrome P450 n=1 Tax=Nocardia jiangxiensis TaxID=282685 RepID=A0ABW6S3V4_9NOCA
MARLFDPASRPDPYPLFDALRDNGPFLAMNGAMVVVTDHERASAILRDPAVSSDRRRSLVPGTLTAPDNDAPLSFLTMDPPDHTRLRKLVSKAFTSRVAAELEPTIRAIVAELLADIADSDSFDVVSQFAYPLPVRIITQLLGVPVADHEWFEGCGRRVAAGLDPAVSVNAPDQLADIHAAQREFREYFLGLIADRRRTPTEDLLSKLVLIEEHGDQLTEHELITTCVLLLLAGHETTANLITGGVLALLRHPDQLAALRTDPALISGAVEEALRYDTPVQLATRIVRKPTVLGEVTAPTDAMVLMFLSAANRDPAVFDEPDRFDITRDARAHLSFAAGTHFCLGAGLARMEASIALSAFADRVVRPELDEDSLRYRPHLNLRGPERMVVGFESVRT